MLSNMEKDLTIKEIQLKQIQLENEIEKLLKKFHKETTLKARGEINFGRVDDENKHYVILRYDNPFQ